MAYKHRGPNRAANQRAGRKARRLSPWGKRPMVDSPANSARARKYREDTTE